MSDEARILLDAAGKPVTVDNLPDNPDVVIARTVADAIPTMIAGFSVHFALAPYPLNSASHRRAVYVDLVPVTDEARKLCDRNGGKLIRASTPLTPHGLAAVRENPLGKTCEQAVIDTLRSAVKTLRGVTPVPRQAFEQRK